MSLRLLGKNAIIYGVGILALRLVAFLPIPLYTRYLAISEFGLLEILLVTIQLMIFMMRLGSIPTFMRFYSDHANKNTIGELLGSTLLVILAGGIVTTSLCLLLLPHLFSILHIESSRQMLALACGVAFTQALTIDLLTYFRAGKKPLLYTIASVCLAAFILLFIFVFVVLLKLRVTGVLLAQIAANSIAFLCLSVCVFPRTGLSCSIAVIRRNLAFGIPLIFAMCGWLFMRISDRYFLGYFESLAVVGMYSLGVKMASIMQLFIARPFELAFLPYVFSQADNPQLGKIFGKVFSYLMLMSVLAGFGIILLSRELIMVAGPEEYHSAYKAVICAVPVFVLTGLYCWVYGILCTIKKTWVIGMMLSFATGLNLILNYLMIPTYGWFGAILATTLSYLVCVVALFLVALKYFTVEFEWRKLLVISLIMLILLLLSVASFNISSYVSYAAIILILFLPFVLGFFDIQEKAIIKNLVLRVLPWNKRGKI